MSTRKRVETTTPASIEPWHVKYRPKALRDVVGQDDIVAAIEAAIADKARQHCFFLFGPGGVGKTTLARIMAGAFGCLSQNIVEVDAASNTGIDDVRRVTEAARYQGFGDQNGRAYIFDECHRLSANAWDSLLKSTEEAPAHVFYFFASTNPAKIPAAMLTRGPKYALNAVKHGTLMDLLEWVCDQEGLSSAEVPDWMVNLAASEANGSPRQAIINLAGIKHAQDEEEARRVLQSVGENKDVIDLCRLLMDGRMRWADVQRLLGALKDDNAEGIRIVVTAYFSKVLMGCKPKQAARCLDVLDVFSTPCNPSDKLAPILLGLGKFCDDV